MSYLVLARKWRPQTFAQVVGQPHVVRVLENAVKTGRIAHAYLFTGARGVGKTSVARIFAKALNCAAGPTPTPCNECSNCREITAGNSPDVIEMDGASNNSVDDIRELREAVRFRPAKSVHKVYIIDEVHMLSVSAFNALLKTLEEPPEHVVFVMATTDPQKVPATILSRCQRFDFRRVSTSRLFEHLKDIATREGSSASEAVLYSIAREADGSVRDAQSLLEQVLSFGDMEDTELLDVLGVVDRRSVLRVGRAVLAGDMAQCLSVVDDLYRRGIDVKRFCRELCDHFRNLLFVALEGEGGASWLDAPEEEVAALREEAKGVAPEALHLAFQMLLKGEEDIRRSALPRTLLEMLLLRLASLPRIETLDVLIERIGEIEGRLGATPRNDPSPPARGRRPAPREEARDSAPPPRPPETGERRAPYNAPLRPAASPPPPPEPPRADAAPGEEARQWEAFLLWLADVDPIFGAKVSGSRVENDGAGLSVSVTGLSEETLRTPEGRARLSNLLTRYFGREMPLTVSAIEKPASPSAAPRPDAPSSHSAHVLEHPIVQKALDALGGTVVDVRRVKAQPGRKDSGA